MASAGSGERLTREDLQGVFALYSARRLPEALAATRRLLAAHPDAPLLLNILGLIHAGLGQWHEAITSYRRVLQVNPVVAETHFHLGNALAALGDRSEALGAFERAVQLKPEFIEAHSCICRELERANRIEDLQQALLRAEGHCPGEHPLLQLRRAELARRKGDLAGARALLAAPAGVPADPDTRQESAYLMAELCDRLGDAGAAFQAAAEGNRLCAASYPAQRISAAPYLDQIGRLSQCFTADWVAGWRSVEVARERPDPVFLVGFPRSGTTLLDTLLRSHPAVSVAEEKPTVSKLEQAVSDLPGGYPDALAALNADQLEHLRSVYFAELAKHLDRADPAAVVVDKLPLNMVHAGLLQRVFPGSRFLFALRHPCDSVLSCYLRAFDLNEGMVNFLQLADAAGLYDRTMRLWRQYREVLPLQVHAVRYEALVNSLEEALIPTFDFLDLPWDDAVLDYASTARQRGNIQTPSYHQVTETIYSRASGRWERYREQLAPVLPVLGPWAEQLGYAV
jgi:tetratricopeptide (TPR) repeat protein